MTRFPLLYIAGSGRSGSTLLGSVIGLVPGFVNVGELMFVWGRGILENQLCGCGAPFLDCPFWGEVGEKGYGGWTAELGERGEQLRSEIERNRFVPGMAAPRLLTDHLRHSLRAYRDLLHPLYRAVHEVTGGSIVVETSKQPAHASVIRHVDAIEMKVCLLLRDSRGVAYSWTRKKKRPEIQGADTYMDTYPTWRAAAEWTGFATAFAFAPLLGMPMMRMRYEDFMATPQPEVERLVRFANPEVVDVPVLFRGHTVELATEHTVAGNPGRFRVGEVELVPDEEWREKFSPVPRMKMTAMTFPWLLRYGYLRRRDRPQVARSMTK